MKVEFSDSAEEFELVRLKSGVMSLRSLQNRETFHPVTGPAIEAQILHVDQQRLVERAASCDRFVIWDVGLGAAANALAAVRAFLRTQRFVEIHSFDRSTGPLRFALENANSLRYPLGFENTLIRLMESGCVHLTPFLSWHLHWGDFRTESDLPGVPAPHAIFYDPYSSATNPEMWTFENFQTLFRRLDPAHPCLLTNYTRSTAVRVSLLLAGFFVGTGCSVGEKTETTIASNQIELLENPLDQRWLDRVKASRKSAPVREWVVANEGTQTIGASDFERLCALPQFKLQSRLSVIL